MNALPGSAASRILKPIGLQILLLIATLAAAEVVLRATNLRYLRVVADDTQSIYDYDAEVGWFPIPNSSVTSTTDSRTVRVRHNSLGLRDIEIENTTKPTIAFIGDSFVWGYDAEAEERFTDLLRPRLPQYRIVNAGVSGYGTDQELLLLRRLWDRIRPRVVVLVFCSDNDRYNNTTNSWRDSPYKPYFVQGTDGRLHAEGVPVPWGRQTWSTKNSLARHSWVARAAISGYVLLRHPVLTVEDPTEGLVDLMRQDVESRGATFLVAIQGSDAKLEAHLKSAGVRFVSLAGIDHYPRDGDHWTPEGHRIVADRIVQLLGEAGVGATLR